jgi:hypothetical protein
MAVAATPLTGLESGLAPLTKKPTDTFVAKSQVLINPPAPFVRQDLKEFGRQLRRGEVVWSKDIVALWARINAYEVETERLALDNLVGFRSEAEELDTWVEIAKRLSQHIAVNLNKIGKKYWGLRQAIENKVVEVRGHRLGPVEQLKTLQFADLIRAPLPEDTFQAYIAYYEKMLDVVRTVIRWAGIAVARDLHDVCPLLPDQIQDIAAAAAPAVPANSDLPAIEAPAQNYKEQEDGDVQNQGMRL